MFGLQPAAEDTMEVEQGPEDEFGKVLGAMEHRMDRGCDMSVLIAEPFQFRVLKAF